MVVLYSCIVLYCWERQLFYVVNNFIIVYFSIMILVNIKWDMVLMASGVFHSFLALAMCISEETSFQVLVYFKVRLFIFISEFKSPKYILGRNPILVFDLQRFYLLSF